MSILPLARPSGSAIRLAATDAPKPSVTKTKEPAAPVTGLGEILNVAPPSRLASVSSAAVVPAYLRMCSCAQVEGMLALSGLMKSERLVSELPVVDRQLTVANAGEGRAGASPSCGGATHAAVNGSRS